MLTKQDAKMAQGLGILAMVMLHLFCRRENFPYNVYIFLGDIPLLYYFGLFGDICVPIYCFCSGYAQFILQNNEKQRYYSNSIRRVARFLNHYWLIVVIFACIGFFCDSTVIPGSFNTFLGNFFLFRLSYNGAWWFVITYMLLLILAPFIKKLVDKISVVVLLLVSGAIYMSSYILRFVYVIEFELEIINWFYDQLILLGTSQFSFVVGMFFCKYDIIGNLNRRFKSRKKRNTILYCLLLIMFIIHCIEESAVIAPITGIVTISCFHLWKKPDKIKKFFDFFGNHSTNIWLTHMFFYEEPFKDLVFIVKYPILILLFLLTLCILISYGIDMLEKMIKRITNKVYFCLVKN